MTWKLVAIASGVALVLMVLYHIVKARNWVQAERATEELRRRRETDREIKKIDEGCQDELAEVETEDLDHLRARHLGLWQRLLRRQGKGEG